MIVHIVKVKVKKADFHVFALNLRSNLSNLIKKSFT